MNNLETEIFDFKGRFQWIFNHTKEFIKNTVTITTYVFFYVEFQMWLKSLILMVFVKLLSGKFLFRNQNFEEK